VVIIRTTAVATSVSALYPHSAHLIPTTNADHFRTQY